MSAQGHRPLESLAGEEREAAMAAGQRLFASPPAFLMGVADMRQLPAPFPAEVAFAGRSNVGKSSLINALFNRRDAARVSNTPGRTRELNYFTLAEGRLALVDMPGYGYAKAPKSLVKKWQALVRDYLRGRPSLRRVFILVDSRHGLKEQDRLAMDLLDETAVNYQVVLTKADKTRKDALEKLVARIAAELAGRPAAHPEIHVTSARKKTGLDELRAGLAGLLTRSDDIEVVEHAAGVRPATADRNAFLGTHPEQPRLHLFNGFGARGALSIPWYATRMADHLLQGRPLPAEADLARHA